MNCKLLTQVQTVSSQFFSPQCSFMKCSPSTQSSNLMIEIDICMDYLLCKVIYINIGVYVFYMCLYVYKYMFI